MARETKQTRVNYRGEVMTLAEAVRASGTAIILATVKTRIRSGWPLLRALTVPVADMGQDG